MSSCCRKDNDPCGQTMNTLQEVPNEEGSYPSRSSPYAMLPVNEAIATIQTSMEPLEIISVPLNKALNYIAAQDIRSSHPFPRFRASTMDGYAVVSSGSVGTLFLVGKVTAGGNADFTVKHQHAAYITTGSPLPSGADAVIKVEDTIPVKEGDTEIAVITNKAASVGQFVREIGSDIAQDEVVLPKYATISPISLGLLAMVGVSTVNVFRKPRVGVMSTGDELVNFGDTVQGGQIFDSNRPMLLAAVQELHAIPEDLGICSDHENLLESTIRKAFDTVDVLITSGGVSMGERDLIKPIMEKLGHVHFGRIFMKPGKPTTFATIEQNGKKKFFFALPGNPVSSMVVFQLLVQPALNVLSGIPVEKSLHHQIVAKLLHSIPLDSVRPEYHRAIVSWDSTCNEYVASSTGKQASSRLLSCREANALLCLPVGNQLNAGEQVVALMIGTMAPASLQSSYHGSPLAHLLGQPLLGLNDFSTSSTNPKPLKETSENSLPIRACILTVSDSASSGERVDSSGTEIRKFMENLDGVDINVVDYQIVSDEKNAIKKTILEWQSMSQVQFIVTTGGTGFSPRDVTPEAVEELLDRKAPGLVIAMMQASLQCTPKACLSRPVSGMIGNCLIITLPGSPKAVRENLEALSSALPHALYLLQDVSHLHHKGKKTPTKCH